MRHEYGRPAFGLLSVGGGGGALAGRLRVLGTLHAVDPHDEHQRAQRDDAQHHFSQSHGQSRITHSEIE